MPRAFSTVRLILYTHASRVPRSDHGRFVCIRVIVCRTGSDPLGFLPSIRDFGTLRIRQDTAADLVYLRRAASVTLFGRNRTHGFSLLAYLNTYMYKHAHVSTRLLGIKWF